MRTLSERRLLPLIGSRLLDEAPDLVPAGVAEEVGQAVTRARAQNMALEAASLGVTRRLATGGIPSLPLKGPGLAEAAHGDLGSRSSNDIDLLVPREALHESVALLRADGYTAPTDRVAAGGLPHLHYGLSHPTRPPVELHWRVHWYEDRFSAEVLSASQPDARGVLTATQPHLAACLLLFMARDGFQGIRMAADAAGWHDGLGASLGDGALDEIVTRHPALARPLEAAARVTEVFTGVRRARWLSSRPGGDRRIALACGLADWSSEGDIDQLKANVSLVDGLLAPRGGSRAFMRRQVFATEEPRWPAHAAKMVARYGLGLALAARRTHIAVPAYPRDTTAA